MKWNLFCKLYLNLHINIKLSVVRYLLNFTEVPIINYYLPSKEKKPNKCFTFLLIQGCLEIPNVYVVGEPVKNFVPFVDYKERSQLWKWIGTGRDSDQELQSLYLHWLKYKEEGLPDQNGMKTPPPRR